MNLTRMRSFHWENYVSSVYNHWKTQLTWGDQDIINIIFHYHSEDLFLLDCTENYRPDQCQYGLLCKNAPHLGVKVMHGSRNAFHNLNQPVFGTIHKIMKNYQIGTDPSRYYLEPLLNEFETLRNSENNCAKNIKIYTKIAKQLWEKPYDK